MHKKNQGRVVCKMPRAGLGNQLFPLLKAFVFGALNDLPVTVTGYHHLKIGPWLRGEKTKRKYLGFFQFQQSLPLDFLEQLKLVFLKSRELINEPAVKKNDGMEGKKYKFSAMPHWDNYFEGLKENRSLVKEIFPTIVQPVILKQLNELKNPCIGVHIRMGDFRKLNPGENFATVGAVRTPEAYFIEIIKSIRKMHGSALPVAVFSDGYKEELKDLLLLKNIQLVQGNNDLVDLLLLSRSKIIVTSAGSTFSYWSAFLADAPVIMHPDHLHAPLRPDEVNRQWYEGPFDKENELLLKNIRAIPF